MTRDFLVAERSAADMAFLLLWVDVVVVVFDMELELPFVAALTSVVPFWWCCFCADGDIGIDEDADNSVVVVL